ncbi:molybdopterin molybdotransferase MoeA [Dasania sp. GY-MA-18]|uniref:Molybdopterin molybdenumtransferase n=1 Tax=Dasania phycosphaerae TaxID=2950436 RepID=A0A9J6RKX5_9GAMM|nr:MULTISPECIES: molybdopterin molybdotransferase MoeA [Dasania]MCR8922620.1 molybdopterin molybdotransferase MoeA [Dasania sp. GY-MA-18]MCZ0865050.1 molybdopterin molybdotransferase MoeA [Dasania phycosphaerae]MCZ0868776.1 molybdopterin molybdotransferase MoeA [Dasania phycosphaerae]
MDSCDSNGLMPLETAQQLLQAAVSAISDTETVDLEQALDRVLACDLAAGFNVPGYDNSAMDGYALRAGDLATHSRLELIGKSMAGAPFAGPLGSGQCVRIMTGAAIPEGADCVIMQERCTLQDQYVSFQQAASVNNNIRFAGEDIAAGSIILQQGKRLSPVDIGLIASVGLSQVTVYRRPKVALFSTGDELQLPGTALAKGCIYDSNRYVVAAMLTRLGAEVLNLGVIADDPQRLEQVFQQAAQDCDAIISSGGVSVGEADYTKDILSKIGQINFWKIAIKPGKPFAFGTIGQALFFGLPGNPVAATVTFHQLVTPILRALAGEQNLTTLTLNARTASPLKKQPGRADFQRGILSRDDKGQLVVNDTGEQGSGILSSVSKANCFIKIPREAANIAAGELVEVIPFDRWLS